MEPHLERQQLTPVLQGISVLAVTSPDSVEPMANGVDNQQLVQVSSINSPIYTRFDTLKEFSIDTF